MHEIIALARSTFFESYRRKFPLVLLPLAAGLIALSVFIGEVTIGERTLVVVNFGLFALSFFTILYMVIYYDSVLDKKVMQRASQSESPSLLSPTGFIAGKYLGIVMTVFSIIFFLGICFSCFLLLFSGSFLPSLFQAYWHIFLEALLVAALLVFFSTIVVTPCLSGLFVFGLFLAGRSSSLLLALLSEGDFNGVSSSLIQALYYLVPNFQKLNISNQVGHGIAIPWGTTLWSSLYAIGYSVVLVVLAQFLFAKRDSK